MILIGPEDFWFKNHDFSASDPNCLVYVIKAFQKLKTVINYSHSWSNADDNGNDDKTDDENLIATIREQIAPNSWFSRGGNGRVLVEKNSRMLIVLQEPGVHREVRNYLGGFSGE